MGRSFRFLLLAALAGCTTNNDSISFGGFPRAVAVDATHAYVAGDLISFFFLKKGAQTDQWRIEKRQLSDGAPDPAFGSGGAVIVRISAAPRAIVLDATSLYVGGGGSSGWRLEKRDLATGSLVAGFGAGGVATGATTGSVRAMAADATSLYLAGDEGSGINTQWRIEKRLLADGSLDPAFGAAGVVTINPAGGDDFPNALVIDATSLYVGGVDSGGDGSRRRIEKRALSDGTPDAAFGAAGVLIADLPGAEAVGGLGLDATSLYVGGSDSSAGSPRWRIEKRNLSDGALDAAFGTAGVVIPVLSGFGGGITAITLEGTAFYASGYEDLVPTPLAESQWRIEKRNASDGSPVAAFGTGGVVTRNRTNRTDVPHAAAAGAAGLMVVGEGNTSTHAWQLELFTSAAGATIWSR